MAQIDDEDIDESLNTKDFNYEGCYGAQVNIASLKEFLIKNFELNDINEKNGIDKWPLCIWGHAGTGKTQCGKDFRKDGWTVVDVPIAQVEEMGDLHGIPMDCLLMVKGTESHWVPQREITIKAFEKQGWTIDINTQPRTIMSPPEWVPITPGKVIVLLDDWNRASIRIIKGIMQLLQNFGTLSWKLPKGCQIVLTGNPDEQDYLVTTIDQAILTRIKHVTLRFDEKLWAQWATQQGIDSRIINYVLYYPEMLTIHSRELTNPRTMAEFGRYLATVKSIYEEDVNKNSTDEEIIGGIAKEVSHQAFSLLDAETVRNIFVFLTREMEDIVEPEDILNGNPQALVRCKKLMSRKEPRIDILGITMERLYATVLDPNTKQTPSALKNLQAFLVSDCIMEDMMHSFGLRLCRNDKNRIRNAKWLIGSEILQDKFLNNMRDPDE